MDVLIAEPDPDVREVFKEFLSETKYDVVAEVTDGLSAVRQYKEHEPDAVLTHDELPECSGIKAAAAIKKLDSDAAVVLTRSLHGQERGKLAVKAGIDWMIRRPTEYGELLEALDVAVDDDRTGMRCDYLRATIIGEDGRIARCPYGLVGVYGGVETLEDVVFGDVTDESDAGAVDELGDVFVDVGEGIVVEFSKVWDAPEWIAAGVDVVVADHEGRVVESFTVGRNSPLVRRE